MNKLPQNLRNHLKNLQAVKPDSTWRSQTEQQLVAELQISAVSSRSIFSAFHNFVSSYLNTMTAQLTWRSVGVFVLLFGLVVGPGIATVSAARGSLPGDKLYTVKRGLEKAKVSLVFSETKKAELQIDFVAKRLDEIHRITQEQAPSTEREETIVLALAELEKGTTKVKEHLENVKTDDLGDGPEKAVELAKIIDEKASDYKEDLRAAVASLGDGGDQAAEEDLKEALSSVQGVSIEALGILVDSHEGGAEDIDSGDLKERVQKQLDTTKELMADLQERLGEIQDYQKDEGGEEGENGEQPADDESSVGDSDESDIPEEVESEEESLENTDQDGEEGVTDSAGDAEEAEGEEVHTEAIEVQDLPTIEELQSVLEDELAEQLMYAEELLELEDFSEALDKLAEMKDKVDELSLALRILDPVDDEEAAVEEIEEEQSEDPAQNQESGQNVDNPSGESEDNINSEEESGVENG